MTLVLVASIWAISVEVDNDPRAPYFQQVQFGVYRSLFYDTARTLPEKSKEIW